VLHNLLCLQDDVSGSKETQLRVPDPCPYLSEKHPQDAEILRWLLSMSVRFVSSKKEEKGEKHQRRSHNAEAESKNEHRVERGVVGQ
jgi:hypothetical protein